MNLYKSFTILLVFSCEALAFSNMSPKFTNKLNNISLFTKTKHSNIHQNYLTNLNLNRGDLFRLASIFPYIFTSKEKPIELPKKTIYNNTKDINNLNNSNVDSNTRIKIDAVLNNIMTDFTKNGNIYPEKSIGNLQKYCSKSNIIKYKNVRRITASFQDGKYALLLGKFINYEIINYEKDVDNIYYNVDMKVNAEYKTMLQNGIQFNDMYYPKDRDYNNVCSVIYRWSFKRYELDNLYIEGCFLMPPNTQQKV